MAEQAVKFYSMMRIYPVSHNSFAAVRRSECWTSFRYDKPRSGIRVLSHFSERDDFYKLELLFILTF